MITFARPISVSFTLPCSFLCKAVSHKTAGAEFVAKPYTANGSIKYTEWPMQVQQLPIS